MRVMRPDVEERHRPDEKPEVYAERTAIEKACAVYDRLSPARRAGPGVVLAADTVVTLDGRILEKPADEADAVRMLNTLSGRRHTVFTGVCLIRCADGRRKAFVEGTEVTFRELAEEEIADYVATGEPRDKAGAYGIQGGAAQFVTQVEGSYTNVVGLPMEAVRAALADM